MDAAVVLHGISVREDECVAAGSATAWSYGTWISATLPSAAKSVGAHLANVWASSADQTRKAASGFYAYPVRWLG